ncbi:sigma-54 dependent transcriptional regulator PrdR [Paramaledivibacter caminithermalis]|jgi:PAS domain S-box-containing protein|uniref:PAS domain S-box-containing protein n=1 Tax=Paramaledivibacter caminithermalis (strain DSM 15212 / CIP 107654 / DViRD3) TaxID=1121301 RepID=A0A1M6LIE9_PARC5|nr:sigma-54 dependent transcriptional regulator PrdR [Paramaledivibacter caminithermalis]SHJ70979.1 PAS domain S-box-containing protein [Paramaledivibacter caminithermalis DSM 15212]
MFLHSKKLLAKDIMSKEFLIANENYRVNELIRAMLKENIEEVFIVDKKNKLIGFVRFIDIVKMIGENLNQDIPIKKYIDDAISVDKTTSLLVCKDIMLENRIRKLPVIENGEIIGVIKKDEVLNYLYTNLKKSQAKLNHILDSIHEALCVIDKEGQVVFWNEKSEKLYDVSSKEIVGRHMKDFFPDAMILKVLKSRQAVKNVYHMPKKDYHIIINVEPIWIDGEFSGAVSTDRDISEVKKMSSELQKANETLQYLEEEMKRVMGDQLGEIIGKSEKIRKKIETARQIAATEASILLTGESGTGKEVFARYIHDHSDRKGLFIPINCSAIPNELFESEFFGYEKGAFTGANNMGKIGLFELAEDGTIFLDEIGDLPLSMQAKLLRVLQEKQIKRVGGNKYIPINARVISATNVDLKKLVEEKKFRQDLYYRINVVEINLPPLREREGDIPLLIDSFLKELCKKNKKNILGIEPEVLKILENYHWEGNIRELKNTIENLVVLCRQDTITIDLIPKYIINRVGEKRFMGENSLDLNKSIKKFEVDMIRKALELANGNKVKAAKLLNIPRTTLYYKLESYKIECR